MFAWGDSSTSDTLLDVGRSDACAVGRSGKYLEAPCWRTISLVASPFASIDTIAAWSNGKRHGDGRIPVMHRAMHGYRHAFSRASPRIPRILIRG